MLDDIGPHMLPARGVIGIPDLLKLGRCPQIIDVPVRPCRRPLVVRHARPDAPRSTGAADVDIASGTNAALSKPTDLDTTGG